MTLDEINAALDPLFPSLMGMRVTEITEDRVVAELTVRPELCTGGNILHGGAYMAFADTIGAVATIVNLPPKTRTVTIESKTNFIGARRSAARSSVNARRFIAAAPPWSGRR